MAPRKRARTTLVRVATAQTPVMAPLATRGFRGLTWGGKRSPEEKKKIDLVQATYACTQTGSVTALNLCATGDDYTNRNGRKILMKSLQIRGYFEPEDLIVDNCLARVVILYDCQTNGTLPVVTDILDAATSLSSLNLSNRDRFKVLLDKQYVGAVAGGSPTVGMWKKFKRLNLETVYNGTGATIGAIQSGSLLMLTISDRASTGGINFKATTRVRFTDP